MSDTDDDGWEVPAPWWCPWCEAVITLDGEIVTREADAYWHTYDHMDKAPYAHDALEAFDRLDTVAADEHIPSAE